MDRNEQVNWLNQLAHDLASNNWEGTPDDKLTFWENRVGSIYSGAGIPDWYNAHDHDLVVRFMEAQQ